MIRIITSLMLCFCLIQANADNIGVQKRYSLENAFADISELPYFQTIYSVSLIKECPYQLGAGKVTICGNSKSRDLVLEILEKIPQKFLFSERRTDNNKIRRFYFEGNDEEKFNLLYVFVGIGGNDLVAILFTNIAYETCEEVARLGGLDGLIDWEQTINSSDII